MQRQQLEITIRDTTPTPAPIPANAPDLNIVSTIGQKVTYTLRDPGNPNKRGKPDGVGGASIFYFVGDVHPATLSGWESWGNVGETNGTLIFNAATVPPGSKVWLAAAWFNTRNQAGPVSDPRDVYLPGGVTQAA